LLAFIAGAGHLVPAEAFIALFLFTVGPEVASVLLSVPALAVGALDWLGLVFLHDAARIAGIIELVASLTLWLKLSGLFAPGGRAHAGIRVKISTPAALKVNVIVVLALAGPWVLSLTGLAKVAHWLVLALACPGILLLAFLALNIALWWSLTLARASVETISIEALSIISTVGTTCACIVHFVFRLAYGGNPVSSVTLAGLWVLLVSVLAWLAVFAELVGFDLLFT